MGWRFRKIFQYGPFRWTLSKRGIGTSWGIAGFRIGISPSGDRYISLGLPGTGLYFIRYFRGSSPQPPIGPSGQGQSGKPVAPAMQKRWWTQKDIGD